MEVLRDFKLTDYEIKVLLTLISEGELTASQISSKSGIPRTSVYEAVKSLEKKGFITSFGKPLRFKAMSAKYLVSLFTDKLKEKLEIIDSGLRELEKSGKEEIVRIIRGDIAYTIISEEVKNAKSIYVASIGLDDKLREIFKSRKVKIHEKRSEGFTHGIVIIDNKKVILFTKVKDELTIMIGEGEFKEFYVEMLKAFLASKYGIELEF